MFKSLPINQWREDDRPREKMALKGRHSLSDAELLAILIGHGTREYSAVDLGKQMLHHYDGDLARLARASLKELTKIHGIGPAKAVAVMAAMELAARRHEQVGQIRRITSSRDAWTLLRVHLEDLSTEEFRVLYLNQANGVIASEQISKGGINATVIDVRVILKRALEHQACALILAHNHPSGNLKPSEQDVRITDNIRQAARLMDIQVIDHIIVGQGGYFSFMDEGRM